MQSPKLPLVGGIIYPLRNGGTGDNYLDSLSFIGGPTDKDLLKGTQAFYEIHLWLVPSILGTRTDWYILAAHDEDLSSLRIVSQGQISAGNTYPVKLLDGYPMRGKTTLSIGILLQGEANDYPFGAQMFGYAYRVGRGQVSEPERRFIGLASPDGVAAGVPLGVAAGDKVQLHKFENNRLDELSLHFQPLADAQVDLYFEDAGGNPVIPGHKVSFQVPALQEPNSVRDPQSVYTIDKAIFGNVIYPTLDHISIGCDQALYVDGYFTRW
jgi:hypothetical protein